MSNIVPVARTEMLVGVGEKINIPIAVEIKEEKEGNKCCCLKDKFLTNILEISVFSFVAFGILYLCNYMGVRKGWEGPFEGQEDRNARFAVKFAPTTFGTQFVYLIFGNFIMYKILFGRNIFIKHHITFNSLKKRRETFNNTVQLINKNHVALYKDTSNEETKLNHQEVLDCLTEGIKDYMLEGNVYYNNDNKIVVLWKPLSKSKKFECCSKTNDTLRKKFKNQSLPFKMYVGFHILTFIVVYILIIVGQDKWFSSKGNKHEIETFNIIRLPVAMLTPKMIDYDNELISVFVWTGYVLFYPFVNLLAIYVAVMLIKWIFILIMDILWCCFDCLICYFSVSALERLVKRRNSICCDTDDSNNSDIWLFMIALKGGPCEVRRMTKKKLDWKTEFENAKLCGISDPVLKINKNCHLAFVHKGNKNILRDHFKYRYGCDPVWGRVLDNTGESKIEPSAPVV